MEPMIADEGLALETHNKKLTIKIAPDGGETVLALTPAIPQW